MKPAARYLSLGERNSYRRLEDVVGCKWSSAVLAAIDRGVQRPGQLERFIPGISTKVLNERLRKLLDYQLISRTEFPGRILRVEYELTATGKKLAQIIEQIRALDEGHDVSRARAANRTSPQQSRGIRSRSRASSGSARESQPTRLR